MLHGVEVGAGSRIRGAAGRADPVGDVAARSLDAHHRFGLVTASEACRLETLQLCARNVRNVDVQQDRLTHRRARKALRHLERDLRGGLEMIAPLADQRDRERRDAQQKSLHRRRDGSGVDRVVTHVGSEVDSRHDHVRDEGQQSGHGEVHAVGRRAVDEVEAVRGLAHRQRAIESE